MSSALRHAAESQVRRLASVWAMLRGDEQRERRDEYVEAVLRRGSWLEPADLVAGADTLLEQATGQYPPLPAEWLGCCLEAAHRRRESERPGRRPGGTGEVAPPWVARMWMAVFFARCAERGQPVPDGFEGEIEVVHRHGLVAEHGIREDDLHDPQRVAVASAECERLWHEHRRGGDVREMVGALRGGGE